MFKVIPLPPDFVIEEAQSVPIVLSPGVKQRVETLWQQEKSRRGGALFNGRLLSLIGANADEQLNRNVLFGAFTEYRFFVAQQAEPTLYQHLGIRPLAVTGMMRTPHGVVFGRRAKNVTQDAGLWELLPSGGLSPNARTTGRRIDPKSQLLDELEQEINVPRAAVIAVAPNLLLVDDVTHVHDIVLELHLSVGSKEIMDYFACRRTTEYSDLRFISSDGLSEFVRSSSAVSASSRAIVETTFS